tara:strand:+ start:600 stop:827 length:228 start_codon:yes stop_codon:yes gene_type:complete
VEAKRILPESGNQEDRKPIPLVLFPANPHTKINEPFYQHPLLDSANMLLLTIGIFAIFSLYLINKKQIDIAIIAA